MNKIFSFLKKSNCYKHLIGGLLVGLCALSPWAAIYSAIIAASCLELKDKLHGCQWDWIDWACTVLGGIIAMSFWLIDVPDAVPRERSHSKSTSTRWKAETSSVGQWSLVGRQRFEEVWPGEGPYLPYRKDHAQRRLYHARGDVLRQYVGGVCNDISFLRNPSTFSKNSLIFAYWNKNIEKR